MPGVKAILPTLRRRLSTGDIFKPARKLVKLSLHIRKDFITRVASKNVWVILAPSNGLIAIMNWFQKVSLNEMSGKVLTSPPEPLWLTENLCFMGLIEITNDYERKVPQAANKF